MCECSHCVIKGTLFDRGHVSVVTRKIVMVNSNITKTVQQAISMPIITLVTISIPHDLYNLTPNYLKSWLFISDLLLYSKVGPLIHFRWRVYDYPIIWGARRFHGPLEWQCLRTFPLFHDSPSSIWQKKVK